MEKIKVLIANDTAKNQGMYETILSSIEEIQVVGEVFSGDQVLKKTQQLLPDIIIMDINFSAMKGATITEKITLNNPKVAVIIVSNDGDLNYLKKAMLAGARDCLIRPFQEEELVEAIKRIYQMERQRMASLDTSTRRSGRQELTPQVITVFGTKGGAGKTTLSVNLAVQLAQETKKKVVLVDLDLQFGDVAVFLNIVPKRSIAELIQEKNQLDIDLVEGYLVSHASGVKILPAPMRPEDGELITAEYVMELLTLLRSHYDYVLIDTPPLFLDTVLSALDMSNQVLMIMSMDLPAIKNMKLTLDLLDALHHRGKTKLILNRASEDFGLSPKDVEKALDFYICHQIPSDGKTAVRAANRGIPFILNKSSAKISKAVEEISSMVIKDKGYQNDLEESNKKRSAFRRIFG